MTTARTHHTDWHRDRVWDPQTHRWVRNHTVRNWHVFDDPPWDIQFSLPSSTVMQQCLVCRGTGLDVVDRKYSWTWRKNGPFVSDWDFLEICPHCAGCGVVFCTKQA